MRVTRTFIRRWLPIAVLCIHKLFKYTWRCIDMRCGKPSLAISFLITQTTALRGLVMAAIRCDLVRRWLRNMWVPLNGIPTYSIPTSPIVSSFWHMTPSSLESKSYSQFAWQPILTKTNNLLIGKSQKYVFVGASLEARLSLGRNLFIVSRIHSHSLLCQFMCVETWTFDKTMPECERAVRLCLLHAAGALFPVNAVSDLGVVHFVVVVNLLSSSSAASIRRTLRRLLFINLFHF